MSRAAGIQLLVTPADEQLLRLARKRHANVKWWWGRRWDGRRYGAFCYLCDTYITTWARRFPATQEARYAIDDHRSDDIAAHLRRHAH